jgi:hypothetical protein
VFGLVKGNATRSQSTTRGQLSRSGAPPEELQDLCGRRKRASHDGSTINSKRLCANLDLSTFAGIASYRSSCPITRLYEDLGCIVAGRSSQPDKPPIASASGESFQLDPRRVQALMFVSAAGLRVALDQENRKNESYLSRQSGRSGVALRWSVQRRCAFATLSL